MLWLLVISWNGVRLENGIGISVFYIQENYPLLNSTTFPANCSSINEYIRELYANPTCSMANLAAGRIVVPWCTNYIGEWHSIDAIKRQLQIVVALVEL
jgi:hypothetical protein